MLRTRLAIVLLTAVSLLGLAPVAASAAGGASPVIVHRTGPDRELLAFGGRSHLGGGLFGRRRYGGGYYGGRSYRSGHHLLRRIGRTVLTVYLLHLFFSHGGLSIVLWLVIIGVVVYLFRRRRRPSLGRY